ncbi:hypothetical protein F5Y15DRAFT_31034 [Xylariaceae sp. FL0016]|nr:hypothetical protein F5Y15DRAFT_31034 [Xylariaceae sp. FL0016]
MSDIPTGPGLLYVNSKLTLPNKLNEASFYQWYDDEHIPDVMQSGVIKTALRCTDVAAPTRKVDLPYLVLYPLSDISYLYGSEFAKARATSDLFPEGSICYDIGEFDVRHYRLVQVSDPTEKGKGLTKTVISAQIEAKSGCSSDEIDTWYRKEHLDLIAKERGFLRSTRYKLEFSRNNASSRERMGVQPPEKDMENSRTMMATCTWLAIHEFETDVDLEGLLSRVDSPWSQKIMEDADRYAASVFEVLKVHGNGDLFHDGE